MSELVALWSLPFFRHALYAALLASVLCGVVGTFVVLKRLVSISGGISHAAFGGLGIAFHYGLEPRLGAVTVALLSALGLGALDRGRFASLDAAIGVLWAVGMAVGVVFLHLTPGYAPDLMGYLFGNILLVSQADLTLAAALDLIVLLLFAAFFKELVAVGFDEELARLQGVRVRTFSILLLALVALAVVVLMQIVGIVLVIALLTIPPLVALTLWRGLGAVIAGAIVTGVITSLLGLVLSVRFNLPTGPLIVLVGAAILGLTRLARRLTRRAPPSEPEPAPAP